ncbi:MAG: Calx-beta domain-containing protein, partial [Microvirga sp.]
ATALITVRVRADAVIEASEVFTVTLSGATGATITTATANGTIQDDDLPTLAITATSANKAEGNGGGWTDFTFTVTRSSTDGNPTATWALTGLDANDVEAKSGTVTFSGTSTTAIVTVKVKADAIGEADERFKISLSNPTDAAIASDAGSAFGTILNDDVILTPTLSALSIGENAAAGAVVGTFSPTNVNGIGITYSLAGGGDVFKIENNRLVLVNSLDFEKAASHKIQVVMTDSQGGVTSETFTITVRDELDILRGSAGKDTLIGTPGADRIYGGKSNDKLAGGTGQDVFVFDTKLGTSKTDRKVNFDTITDFNPVDDAIWLDLTIFTNKALKKFAQSATEDKPVLLAKKYFTSGTKAKDKDDYFIHNKKTGIISFDADGSGSKDAIEFAQVKKGLTLKFDDFFFV